MVEIISSILEAEKKADEIISLAAERAKTAILAGESDADTIREKAVADFKVRRKAALLKAEKLASEKYEDKIAEGNAKAKALSVGVKKDIDAEIDKVVAKFIK